MTWEPPEEYWSLCTADGQWRVDDATKQDIMDQFDHAHRFIHFTDLEGSTCILKASQVESLSWLTPETRERGRIFHEMLNREAAF